MNAKRTDDFGLEVRVVEMDVMHEDVVEADHEREDREEDGDHEAVFVETRLALLVAGCQAPLWGHVGWVICLQRTTHVPDLILKGKYT